MRFRDLPPIEGGPVQPLPATPSLRSSTAGLLRSFPRTRRKRRSTAANPFPSMRRFGVAPSPFHRDLARLRSAL